ncbi:MAG: ABC transporter permease [Pseudomonadota bacterium]
MARGSFAQILRRAAGALAAAFGASILIWMLIPLAPGDPAFRILQAQGVLDPTAEEVAEVTELYGLDRPLPEQYSIWASGVLRGDLGISYQSGRPVIQEMQQRLPATVRLTVATLAIALLISVAAALIAARWRNQWPDSLLRVFAFLTAALPAFLIGFIILEFVVVRGEWGAVIGDGTWAGVWLPALALSLGVFATWSRLLRSDLIVAQGKRFALTLRARGLTEGRILTRHALPVAAPSFLHAVGLGIGAILSGAPVIEAVFTWPGLGSYAVQAVSARDMPVIQGYAIYATLVYVASSLAADIAAAAIDPDADPDRVR